MTSKLKLIYFSLGFICFWLLSGAVDSVRMELANTSALRSSFIGDHEEALGVIKDIKKRIDSENIDIVTLQINKGHFLHSDKRKYNVVVIDTESERVLSLTTFPNFRGLSALQLKNPGTGQNYYTRILSKPKRPRSGWGVTEKIEYRNYERDAAYYEFYGKYFIAVTYLYSVDKNSTQPDEIEIF